MKLQSQALNPEQTPVVSVNCIPTIPKLKHQQRKGAPLPPDRRLHDRHLYVSDQLLLRSYLK